MKNQFLSILLALFALPAFTGVKLISGSFDELKGQQTLPFVLDWSKAEYGKGGNLQNFLDKAFRNPDWEEASLSYFYQKANSKTGDYGLRLVPIAQCPDSEYYIIMYVWTISNSGDLWGYMYLAKKGSDDFLAVMSFSSDDADDNDKITFRDQFKSIGESLGSLIQKQLKKMYK